MIEIKNTQFEALLVKLKQYELVRRRRLKVNKEIYVTQIRCVDSVITVFLKRQMNYRVDLGTFMEVL